MSAYRLAECSLNPSLVSHAIVRDLKSHDWNIQNPAINALRIVGPHGVSSLPEAQQRLLGNNVLQAAEGSSNAAISFLRDLPETEPKWSAPFISGAVEETILNEKGEIRFKMTLAKPAYIALKNLPPLDVSHFLKDLAKPV